jgi:hypothetical protein
MSSSTAQKHIERTNRRPFDPAQSGFRWSNAMACATPSVRTRESGHSCYPNETKRLPLLSRPQEWELAKRWREHGQCRGRHAHNFPSSPCGEDRRGLSPLWVTNVRNRFGGECWPCAASKTFRPGARLSFRNVRDVVDQGVNTRTHHALMIAGEDRNDR